MILHHHQAYFGELRSRCDQATTESSLKVAQLQQRRRSLQSRGARGIHEAYTRRTGTWCNQMFIPLNCLLCVDHLKKISTKMHNAPFFLAITQNSLIIHTPGTVPNINTHQLRIHSDLCALLNMFPSLIDCGSCYIISSDKQNRGVIT